MENITIAQIIGCITSLSVIIAFLKLIKNAWDNNVTNKINSNKKEIDLLKQDMSNLKSEVDDSKEERLILLQGLLACLKGLKEQGCDGAVTVSINKIEDYLMKKSH